MRSSVIGLQFSNWGFQVGYMGEAVYPTHHVVVGIGDHVIIVVTGYSRRKERHDRRGPPNGGRQTTERMAESTHGARNCAVRAGSLRNCSTGLLS